MAIHAAWAFTVAFVVGTARNPTSFKKNLAWGTAATILSRPWVYSSVVKPAVSWGARKLAADAVIMAEAAASTSVATGIAAVATGYVLGASGTVIVSSVLEDKDLVREGTTDSLIGFYTADLGGDTSNARDRSKWYESDIPVLNIPGDVAYIGKHYWGKVW